MLDFCMTLQTHKLPNFKFILLAVPEKGLDFKVILYVSRFLLLRYPKKWKYHAIVKLKLFCVYY